MARNITRPGGDTPAQQEARLVAICRLALGAHKMAGERDGLAEVDARALDLYRAAQTELHTHRLHHGNLVGDGLPDLEPVALPDLQTQPATLPPGD